MLTQINITDFAIIKNLTISFGSGLNILSGETGAGKSIIINAVNLILGGRASADLIRSGCKEARVEALFSFPDNSGPLADLLAELEVPYDGELLIKRMISREGRNRITINGSMSTLQGLSRLSPRLISISGQHENQLLLRSDNHLFLLDDFGGLAEERERLGSSFAQCRDLKDEIRYLKKGVLEISEKQELAQFQIQEIEQAEVTLGEDEILLEEKARLQHAEGLREIISGGYETLYDSNHSVISLISQVAKRLEKGAVIDQRLSPVQNALNEAAITLEDASFSLRDLLQSVHMDPERLEQVLERIEGLNRLKRKYGPTLSDVLQTREKLAGLMFDLEEKTERLDKLAADLQSMEADIMEKALVLSEKRKKAANEFEKAVKKELQYLHMKGTRFQVSFGVCDVDKNMAGRGAENGRDPLLEIRNEDIRAEGIDQPEFIISPNVGEDLKPLSKIASGGELSRIMLAIKTILAQSGSVETVIFDEVDAGISGATAEVVGEKVLSLARYHQIICITHLPQIASQGNTHFLVKKETTEGRTHTIISELDDEARVLEIARLLGGKKITTHAIAHAREMINPNVDA